MTSSRRRLKLPSSQELRDRPTEHPSGKVLGYAPGMLSGIDSIDQFAELLDVPPSVMHLAEPLSIDCAAAGCPFKAVDRNGNMCVMHRREWYPLRQQRGSAWLGPEFLRPTQHTARPFHYADSCHCQINACHLMGYCPLGYVSVPEHKDHRAQIMNTRGLFSSETKKRVESGDLKRPKLAFWHFFGRHRELNTNGVCSLKNAGPFEDDEGIGYRYPPPLQGMENYLALEHNVEDWLRPQDRWCASPGVMNPLPLPDWVLAMLVTDRKEAAKLNGDESSLDQSSPCRSPKRSPSKTRLRFDGNVWRDRFLGMAERAMAQEARAIAAEDERDELKAKYDSLVEQFGNLEQLKDEDIAALRRELSDRDKIIAELQVKLVEAKKRKGQPLRYRDLEEDGLLGAFVKDFTFFPSKKANDAFLKMCNHTDGSDGSLPEGDGYLENLRAYSHVTMKEREGEVLPPSFDPDSSDYKEHLARSCPARLDGVTYQDEYFAWSVALRSGMTQDAIRGLFGFSSGKMSDVVHSWTQVMDDALQELFPQPSRSQMLQAYPDRFVEADGHCRTGLLLDAFEVFVQQSSLPGVGSSTHSDYKKHCTAKFAGGVDVIGCPWNKTVPDGFPGAISDKILTIDTKILREVPFGGVAKVDKGFIVNNEGAEEGVVIDRPQKRMKLQVQQSAEDTAQTQLLGNTRIIVENVNGEMKVSCRYLNALIPVTQFGLLSQIVRVAYLMQNFKRAVVQHRGPDAPEPEGGRPARGEIRWYGATDGGLSDYRPHVRLWGLKVEIKRHAELKLEHPNLTDTEISEMVLAEDWPSKLRKDLYRIAGKDDNGNPINR